MDEIFIRVATVQNKRTFSEMNQDCEDCNDSHHHNDRIPLVDDLPQMVRRWATSDMSELMEKVCYLCVDYHSEMLAFVCTPTEPSD